MASRSVSGLRHRRRTLPALLASVLLVGTTLVGCSTTEDAASPGTTTAVESADVAEGFPVTITFDPYDPVTIEDQPERIVSLSPTTTEMLFAVGAGEQVVAVDEYSNYPADAPLVEGLSGFTPNVESVLEYDPDLVLIMNKGEGIIDGLNAAGVPVVVVPSSVNLEDTYEQIGLVGEASGHADAADELVEEMKRDVEDALASVSQEFKDAGLTYYHELTSSYHSASGLTYIGQIYSEFGLASIAPDNDEYPQLTSEAIVAANPDIIFLANTKAEDMDAQVLATRPGWETIDAVVNDQVIGLDDDLASRWGPRVSELVESIADELNERVVPNWENSEAPATVG